jgi:hypothetical protein
VYNWEDLRAGCRLEALTEGVGVTVVLFSVIWTESEAGASQVGMVSCMEEWVLVKGISIAVDSFVSFEGYDELPGCMPQTGKTKYNQNRQLLKYSF